MLTQVLPAYLYQQYTKDLYVDDLLAFFTAYNDISQVYLNNTNELNLPIYVTQTYPLLDWTATSIYGLPRPTLSSSTEFSTLGVYDTVPYNTTAYSEDIKTSPNAYYDVTDDIYKRILTWNFYKGDGFQYTVQWLKRRIARFIYGVDGTDIPNIADLYDVSVVYNGGNEITITIPNSPIAVIFEAALLGGRLNVPFQYTYTIVY